MIKPAQIVSFTPSHKVICPARGNVESYKILEPNVEYTVIDTSALTLLQSDKYAKLVYLDDKLPHSDIKDMAMLFPGGIGDSLSLKACIEEIDSNKDIFPNLKNITIFSTRDDNPIFLDGSIRNIEIVVTNYPPLKTFADTFDAIVGFGVIQRESIYKAISDTFAEVLGIPAPNKCATLKPRGKFKRYFSRILNKNKKKIGLQIYSNAHYRSIPPPTAIVAATILADNGYDVYIIGTSTQRVAFVDSERREVPPPDGIYDFSGNFNGLEELIAFTSLMDGIICPDTSMVHMAGCLKKPTVGVFGCTDGKRRVTYYPTVKALQGPKDCSPCLHIADTPTCGKLWCEAVVEITPDVIANSLMEMI